ncbi:MAG: hypothetical protein ABSF15_05165 [Candidatus Sulfotelmatobacter sp.]
MPSTETVTFLAGEVTFILVLLRRVIVDCYLETTHPESSVRDANKTWMEARTVPGSVRTNGISVATSQAEPKRRKKK